MITQGDLQKNPTPLSLGQSSTFTSCWPSWISVITKNHKNGNYNLWSQHRDLQPTLNPTKFGSIFNFYMVSSILDFSYYQNNKNGNYNSWSQHRDLQPKPNPLSCDQSSTLKAGQPSWIFAIDRNHFGQYLVTNSPLH